MNKFLLLVDAIITKYKSKLNLMIIYDIVLCFYDQFKINHG